MGKNSAQARDDRQIPEKVKYQLNQKKGVVKLDNMKVGDEDLDEVMSLLAKANLTMLSLKNNLISDVGIEMLVQKRH